MSGLQAMFSATHLQGLSGVIASGLRIVGVVVVAWLAIVAAQRAIRGLRIRIASRLGDRESVQRAETLGRVFRYLAAVVVSLVAGTLVLSEIGVSVAPILGDLEMAGVERWADSAVVIRARFKVAPLEQWNMRREYLRRLKNAFDRAGIEIPFPQLTLHRPARRPTAGTEALPS